MSTPSWLESDGDLLHQRRLERGLPPQAEPVRPARGLLLRGTALGGGLLVAALAGWVWIELRQGQVNQALQGAQAIAAQVQNLEGQAQQRRRELSLLNRSSEGLAKGLVAVSSGSALLAQLMAITPAGVQLTDVQVKGLELSLKGLASDPEAFRRVNALSLSLARSPLFEPASIKVVKLSRTDAEPVAWQISAKAASLSAAQQLQLLQQLGAEGLVRRLQMLQRAGLLP